MRGHLLPFSQDFVNYFRSENKKNIISKEVLRIYIRDKED